MDYEKPFSELMGSDYRKADRPKRGKITVKSNDGEVSVLNLCVAEINAMVFTETGCQFTVYELDIHTGMSTKKFTSVMLPHSFLLHLEDAWDDEGKLEAGFSPCVLFENGDVYRLECTPEEAINRLQPDVEEAYFVFSLNKLEHGKSRPINLDIGGN